MKTWLTVLLVFLSAVLAEAQERILDFASQVVIEKTGDLDVTETIRVQAEGNEIKRGIYRDFPTLYKGRWGLTLRVPFKVLGVTRNGQPETWRSEGHANGERVYVGNPDVFLEPGEYTYVIRYRTGDQIGFFDVFDELYWNVTGNGWAFPIMHASVVVDLPPGASVRSIDGYTGPSGAKGTAWKEVPAQANVKIETTAPLAPGEGFTVAVSWPPGYVTPPPKNHEWVRLAKDNLGLLLGIGGLVLALLYFVGVWAAFGRDPDRGVIVPLYQPPEGFGPSAVRYLRGLGKADDRSFASEILELAVHGYVTIKQAKAYSLTRIKPDNNANPPGPMILNSLFGGRSGTFQFKQSNHAAIKSAKSSVAKAAAKQCDSVYFVKNRKLWVVGLLVTLVPLVVSLSSAARPETAIFLSLWLGIWSLGVAALSMQVVSSWRQAGWKKVAAIPITLFAIPFFVGWIFGAGMLVMATSLWVTGCYVVGIVMTAVFHHLLKRPTPEGRKRLDEIEGFRQYLSVAEQDRLNLENPPERTPEQFEKFLPYALALDVEQEWSEQFSDVLAESGFKPEWYAGPALAVGGAGLFASAMTSSFTSAIASSSSAPGSSSGGGGGGSSGGGGGGGGGGGW